MSKQTLVILIHGFNVSDEGEDTVQRLIPYFEQEGYTCINFHYRWTGFLGVKWVNYTRAKSLRHLIELNKRLGKYVIVCGHSNGCALAHMAMQEQENPKYHPDKVIYINAALTENAKPGKGVKETYVLFSPNDRPVVIAQWIANILPDFMEIGRPWGWMGAVGYKGNSLNVKNINEESIYWKLTGEKRKFGHSTIFQNDVLRYMGPFIARL